MVILANDRDGTYTLKAWHEEAGVEIAVPVTVRANADNPASVRLDVSGFAPPAHKNKYGKDYPPHPATEDERY